MENTVYQWEALGSVSLCSSVLMVVVMMVGVIDGDDGNDKALAKPGLCTGSNSLACLRT